MPKPDWTKAAALPPDDFARALDEDHDEIDDNPPTTPEELAAMQVRTRKPGQRGPGKKPAKVLLTVRVEPETLAALKAGGPGWQARVRGLLRKAAQGRGKG
jgi:uncharacterized protein (DUF4415 family)